MVIGNSVIIIRLWLIKKKMNNVVFYIKKQVATLFISYYDFILVIACSSLRFLHHCLCICHM